MSINFLLLFCFTCKCGHMDIVCLLLPKTDYIAYFKSGSFCIAREKGHVDIVKMFLNDVKADTYIKENDDVLLASENGHTLRLFDSSLTILEFLEHLQLAENTGKLPL